MSKSRLVIIVYIIGILIGAIFLDVWSSDTSVTKGLAVLGWTAIFLVALLYSDRKK